MDGLVIQLEQNVYFYSLVDDVKNKFKQIDGETIKLTIKIKS